MALTLMPEAKIRKKDVGNFFQKLSFLINAGNDVTRSVQILAIKESKVRDRSGDGIRNVANKILPDLEEGFPLHEAMEGGGKHFKQFIKQMEVGERTGRVGEVCARIANQIKNESKLTQKLTSAMTYPAIIITLTVGVAIYLFSSVVPDILQMLAEIGSVEVPPVTQFMMNLGDFLLTNYLTIFLVLALAIVSFVVYSKTIGRVAVARMVTHIPFVGKILLNMGMQTFFQNYFEMIEAGAEMSESLYTAADSVQNLFMHERLMIAQIDFEKNGMPVHEVLRKNVPFVREIEIQSLMVALDTEHAAQMLQILAEDREYEAEQSIAAFTTAINPILLVFCGVIVGATVLAVYEPIINVANLLN